MGGLRRKPVPPGTDDEIIRSLARSSSPFSRSVRQFLHAGKSYIAYEGGVPAFKAGTLVATGYSVMRPQCPRQRRYDALGGLAAQDTVVAPQGV